jgi:hypothetical protein
MNASAVLQTKLKDLGYPLSVTGVLSPATKPDSDFRLAIRNFKKTVAGFPDNIYFDSNVLKVIDQKFYQRFPSSDLPKSYYAGWNADLVYGDSSGNSGIVNPDDLYKLPAVVNDNKPMILYGIVVAGLAYYFLKVKGKKKKRK